MANKSKLNELVHKQSLQLPEYNTLPEGDGFICKVKLGEKVFVSEKVHSRKKAAEDDAAAVAVLHFTNGNDTAIDKLSQPIASTNSLQEHLGSQPVKDSLLSRTAAIDSKNQIENTKEIPLNMFYPASQRTEKPSEELQDFCSSHGWTEPIYHLKVKGKESTCGVFVNKVLYSFQETYPSDEEAKQEAAKRVLATLSAKPADQLENTKKGITVIIPASKRSHPATAKLVETAKNIPVASTEHTSTASAEEITSAISKLTMSSGANTKTVDPKDADVKQSDPINTEIKQGGSDKNTLQNLCQKKGIIPEYSTEYPPNEVGYIAKVTVNGKTFSSDIHGSKKAAEAAAAREAIKYLTSDFSESTTTNSTMPKPLGKNMCKVVWGTKHCNMLYFY